MIREYRNRSEMTEDELIKHKKMLQRRKNQSYYRNKIEKQAEPTAPPEDPIKKELREMREMLTSMKTDKSLSMDIPKTVVEETDSSESEDESETETEEEEQPQFKLETPKQTILQPNPTYPARKPIMFV